MTSESNHQAAKAGNFNWAAPSDTVGTSKPRLLDTLGPGLITGASDDDPSGIGTYAQAGAQFGLGISWMMLITYPLMASIQEISARVGRVTGRGIAGNVCRHYPAWLLQTVVVLLFVANAVNIGADLGAMGDALRLLLPAPASLYVVMFGVACILAQIFLRYALYVRVLKWLCVSLFAYIATLATVHVPWGEALKGLIIPRLTWSTDFPTTMVAIAGTTISPYLFFWQAAEEAEDIRVKPERTPLKLAHHQAPAAFARIRADKLVGMAFSNVIAIAIIITTAATLHRNGDRYRNVGTGRRGLEAFRRRVRVSDLYSRKRVCSGCRCSPGLPPMHSAKGGAGRSGSTASPRRPPRSTPVS